MELTITNNREIKPYKVAVKQFESETTTLVFTRDSYMYDQVDLRNYTAYAVTCIGGAVDMTELTYEVVDGKLVITWVVQEYTLRQAGNITYQIVFKENADDGEGTGVFYTYEGLLQCSESIDADRPIAANYPTILKQWLDNINNMAGTISAGVIYMGVGEPIPVESRLAGRLYYQINDAETFDGHFEDNLGNKLGTFTADYKVDADINKMITHGEFICAGTVLNPPIDCAFCMVRVTDSLSTDRVIQEVYIPDDSNAVRVFTRAITGTGTFGEWTELTGKMEKNIGTANAVLVTDADGNVIPHPNVTSQELNALNGFAYGGGTVQAQLDGKVSKTSSWGMPDYSQPTNLVVGTQTVEVDSIGYVCLTATAYDSMSVQVAGRTVFQTYMPGTSSKMIYSSGYFLIPAGSKVKVVAPSLTSGAAVGYTCPIVRS